MDQGIGEISETRENSRQMPQLGGIVTPTGIAGGGDPKDEGRREVYRRHRNRTKAASARGKTRAI